MGDIIGQFLFRDIASGIRSRFERRLARAHDMRDYG
jgi:hypothetical protein